MAEETEGSDVGAQASGAGVDPAAVALALTGADRLEANAYLKDQRAFIADQRHHLHEQFKQTTLGTFSLRLSVALKLLTALLGAVIVVGLIAAVWNASQADGMVVDAFSVPPQFAQDGITGEIVADDLTDRISAIRNIAVNNSISSSKDVSKDSTEDVTVEIPETGVSLGQAWRYLRLWLGHERHLNGNLRLTGDGNIALTVTLDGERVAAVRGAPGDLERLEQQAAEQVFASVDPLNIVLYLSAQGRDAEALAAADHNAQVAVGPADRANAYALWASTTRTRAGDMTLAVARGRIAAELDPKLMAAWREMMFASTMMGHDEEVLRQAQAMQGLREEDQPKNMQGPGFAELVAEGTFERDAAVGNFAQAASEDRV
ncbi:MAG TPA: hypothetical protein VNW15_03085 [Rhizomicrobium sp.]|nr:hypothetical protein [Rhizomicrobium sp.]